ncbi:hypothetical protein ACQUQU_18525 [Thalassolituus sp. LLYu03]|uniref:hypothetical protein n=1 Tax=Thalassolituus sp. LLYu03 TaxID=3421656 RepID=UPI003D27380A
MRRRPSLLLLLIMLLVVVSGGMSSVQDLLRAPGEGGCEYCSAAAAPPRWLPPVAVMLPSMLLDLAPATLAPLISPLLVPDIQSLTAALTGVAGQGDGASDAVAASVVPLAAVSDAAG